LGYLWIAGASSAFNLFAGVLKRRADVFAIFLPPPLFPRTRAEN